MVIVGKRKDGSVIKKIAFSASADEVKADDMDNEVQALTTQVPSSDLERVYLIHTHPDMYAKTTIKEQRTGPSVGFISNISLTDRDVRSADNCQKRFFPGIPVTMIAVGENKLTYSYEAGSSISHK